MYGKCHYSKGKMPVIIKLNNKIKLIFAYIKLEIFSVYFLLALQNPFYINDILLFVYPDKHCFTARFIPQA